jgi:hypothetical protein
MTLIGTDIPAANSSSISTNRLTTAQKLNQTSSGSDGNSGKLQTVFSGTQASSSSNSDSSNNSSNSSVPVINPPDADSSSVATAENKVQANLVTNVLNGYDQATYFITFSLLSDDVSNSQEVILAETGDTNLNIQSLVMDVYPGPGSMTRNTTASMATLTLFESYGSNFPDLLVLSAQKLNLQNYLKALFRLTLRFQGFDPTTGQPNTNIGGRSWQWTCNFNWMTSKVSEAGSMHTVTLALLNNLAYSDQIGKLPQALTAIKLPKATVGTALTAVIQKMNADVVKTYGYAHITYAIEQVPYRTPLSGIANPFDNPIYQDSPYYQSSRNSDTITISGGTSFMSLVDHIFASSPTATKMVASANRVHDTNNTSNLDVVSTFHVVDAIVTYAAFNPTINDYDKNITYVIRPYETVRVFTNISQATQAADLSKTQQKAAFLVQNNYIQKGYDYIYTGNNTEVIDFEIDLNFGFALLTDKALGEIHYHQETVARSFNNNAAKRAYVPQPDMSNGSTAVSGQNTNTSSTSSVVPLSSSSSSTNRLTSQSKLSSNVSTVTYADDLATLTTSNFNPLPMAIGQGGVNHRAQINSFTESDWSAQRSIYGVLLDQLYDNGNTDAGALANISMKVRGDPFWLGNDLDDQISSTYAGTSNSTANGPVAGAAINSDDNSSDSVGNNSTTTNSQTISGSNVYVNDTTAANYLVGENVFVFRFNYAQGYDENTGSATLNESDMFTGFYTAVQVTNTFQDGQFIQQIVGARILGMQVSQLLNISYGN